MIGCLGLAPHPVETGHQVADHGTRLQLHVELIGLTAPDDSTSGQTRCLLPTFHRALEANGITGDAIDVSPAASELRRAPIETDLARARDQKTSAQFFGFGKIVCHQKHRGLLFCYQLLDRGMKRLAFHWIDTTGGLIQQQKARTVEEGPSQCEPLLHPRRASVEPPIDEGVEPKHGGQLRKPLGRFAQLDAMLRAKNARFSRPVRRQ